MRCPLLITALLLASAACSSRNGGTCSRPYVAGATVRVPYSPTCEAGDGGCDLLCQLSCPAAPTQGTYLAGCALTTPDGGAYGDAGALAVSCAYAPYPIDLVCP